MAIRIPVKLFPKFLILQIAFLSSACVTMQYIPLGPKTLHESVSDFSLDGKTFFVKCNGDRYMNENKTPERICEKVESYLIQLDAEISSDAAKNYILEVESYKIGQRQDHFFWTVASAMTYYLLPYEEDHWYRVRLTISSPDGSRLASENWSFGTRKITSLSYTILNSTVFRLRNQGTQAYGSDAENRANLSQDLYGSIARLLRATKINQPINEEKL